MKFFQKYFLIFCILLSGCVSVPEMKQELSNKTANAASFSEMAYQPIKTSDSLSLTFGKQSPVFMFDEGKSYYAAISVTEPRLPRQLKFKSYISTSYLPSANVLVPNFLFLNQEKKPINTTKNFRLNSSSDFFLGPYFEGTVVIPAEASYFIIYTSDSQSTNLVLSSENGQEWTLPNAPAGKLSLELSNPFPADHDFSTVIIKDNVKIYSSSKADFFYVSNINDKKIANSLVKTRIANAGRGLNMNPSVIDREVSIEPATLTIVGRTEYAAPIQALTNTVYEVKGQIKFIPEKNRTYAVQGELGEAYSAVWVEDQESHKVMGEKIEVRGSAKLGIMQK